MQANLRANQYSGSMIANTRITRGRPSVVLVHGAWADGSCWAEVIARLQIKGIRVVAAQCPLHSLASDSAAVRQVLEREAGPVVLVGHGWGGTVITEIGDIDAVTALVYVAAFAPDVDCSTADAYGGKWPAGYDVLLEKDEMDYLWFSQKTMPDWYAQDLPAPNAKVLAATQHPIHVRAYNDKITHAAWHHKPCWYLVAEHDRIFPSGLQLNTALRIGAQVSLIDASHAVFLSRPKETTNVILGAVKAASGNDA